MKAWWSDRYSDENKARLASIFEFSNQGPVNYEIWFVATPDEINLNLFPGCKVLVCPFTTPPQNIPEEIKVIHLGGHPFLHKITPTVELTWQLILRLVRPIDAARQSVLDGEWDRFPFGAERMLSRMNLLVIGRGRIGSRVEVIGQAFGMNVNAKSAFVNGEELKKADIITLHTPPTDFSILGALEFKNMKRGVYIVNTAQGNAIDSRWLLNGLTEGKVAGAALDVKGRNFIPLKHYAEHHDNLILTPHIGGSTKDAWHETQKMAIENALEYLDIAHATVEEGG